MCYWIDRWGCGQRPGIPGCQINGSPINTALQRGPSGRGCLLSCLRPVPTLAAEGSRRSDQGRGLCILARLQLGAGGSGVGLAWAVGGGGAQGGPRGPGGGTPPPALHVTSVVGTCFYLFLKLLFNNARTVADLPPCRAGKHCKWPTVSFHRRPLGPPCPRRNSLRGATYLWSPTAAKRTLRGAHSTQHPATPRRSVPPERSPALSSRGSPGAAPRGNQLPAAATALPPGDTSCAVLGVRGGLLSFPFLVPPCGVCPVPRSFSGPSNTPSHDAPPPSVRGGGGLSPPSGRWEQVLLQTFGPQLWMNTCSRCLGSTWLWKQRVTC